MKKYIKLFLVAILTVFISIIPTYAKEVSLEIPEDGTERDTFGFIIGREQSRINYVYLIGEYAFTSAYKIDIQDVMLAANSIDIKDKTGKINTDPVFNEMTVYLFKPTISGGKITGWNKPEKIVGTTELPDKFNVKYIDYHYVKEDKKVDTDSKVNTAMDQLSKTLFNEVQNVSKNEVTVDVKTDKLKENVKKGMASGVIASLVKLVEDKEIKSIDFKYNDITLNIGENLDIEAMVKWFNDNSENIFGKPASDVILADLLDKEFEATINLSESDKEAYVSQNHGTPTETYKIKFTGERQRVDTNNIAKEALKKLNSTIFKAKEENLSSGSIVITVEKEKLRENIKKGMGSGIIGLLQSLVNNSDVESVDFVYSNDSNVKYTLRKDFDIEDMLSWFEKNSNTIFGYPADQALTVDLINKTFTAKINLKNYAQKQDENPTEYKISFDGELPEVDSEKLLTTVMEKVKKEFFEKDDEKSQEQNIVVKVKSIDTKIEKGMASGLYPALSEIAKTDGIESIDFSYNGLSYKLTQDSTLEEMAEWFDTNKETIFGKKDNITLADLDKKKFTVKVNVGRVGKLKEINKDTYTIEMLKTHDVTFHDEKEKEKEVVTVYDGETIPTDEVTKRTKRDTDTEKFLGWYEEITEGNDKDEEFNFKDTPITSDIELDAHWGTKLTKDETDKMKQASTEALNTIASHKERIEVKVEKQVITVTSHLKNTGKVGLGLAGAGVKTALSNFLDPSKNPAVESITLSFTNNSDNYSADITKKDVDNYEDFVESFDELFQKATGKDIYNFTWDDLNNYIDHVKVKINLKDDKVFEEGNGEYTFKLEIQPTEGE